MTGLLYPSFEFATERASNFIAQEGLPPDQHGYSTIVRWHVKNRLDLAGHEVEFDRDELALIGLSVTYNGNRYRIRKADEHGLLPPPGSSKRLQQYYAQQLRLPFVGPDDGQRVGRNYVILWHVRAGVLTELSLVLPKTSNEWAADWEWHVSIPYPTGLTGPSPMPPVLAPPTPPSTPDLALRLKRNRTQQAG